MTLTMGMRRLTRRLFQGIDASVLRLLRLRKQPPPGLVCFYLHALDTPESRLHRTNYEGLTLEDLQTLIQRGRQRGYQWVSQADLEGGMPPDARWALLTCDDGYAHLAGLMPLLETLHVPVLIFVSSGYAETGQAFWWDALHRAPTLGHPVPPGAEHRFRATSQSRSAQMELYKAMGLPEACWRAHEHNRAFSPEELEAWSKHPLVSLGNHTRWHVDLTRCTATEARQEVLACQADLFQWTGKVPRALAFPYGLHHPRHLEELTMGPCPFLFTTRPTPTPPLQPRSRAVLGRYPLQGGPLLTRCIHLGFEQWTPVQVRLRSLLSRFRTPKP